MRCPNCGKRKYYLRRNSDSDEEDDAEREARRQRMRLPYDERLFLEWLPSHVKEEDRTTWRNFYRSSGIYQEVRSAKVRGDMFLFDKERHTPGPEVLFHTSEREKYPLDDEPEYMLPHSWEEEGSPDDYEAPQ